MLGEPQRSVDRRPRPLRFDSSAIGSDIPRSRKQYVVRRLANVLVKALGLNRVGLISTEIVQAIRPVAQIHTRHGILLCRCGHGRLRWYTTAFQAEEPETMAWLETLCETDVLWDVGAYVGLFSVYAAKFRKCRVFAIEPESQNYAVLVENIVLNGVEDRCLAGCFAVTDRSGMGKFYVRYLTKGAAYNQFVLATSDIASTEAAAPVLPAPPAGAGTSDGRPIQQWTWGVSLDDLLRARVPSPTHLKIDVDGIEPEIIDGASELLRTPSLQSILIEINRSSQRALRIPGLLSRHGFRLVSERSNWESRSDRSREHEVPSVNMIFSRTSDVKEP